MSENGGKMDPKWQQKSVQNLKKLKKGGPKINAKKMMPKKRLPKSQSDSTLGKIGVDFGAAGGVGGTGVSGFDPR